MNPGWVAAITGLAVAVVTVLGWAARSGWRVIRRTMHFLDDWLGEPERDGLDAKPGVMARLQSVEDLVARVADETRPNSGRSLRDVVARTAADVADIKHEQTSMRARIELWERQRAGREERP
jgi:hypothetical protein